MQPRIPNRKLNTLLVVAAIVALGVGANALAQGPGPRGAGPHGGRGAGGCGAGECGAGQERGLARLQARLDLDDEQVAAIKDLQAKSQAANLDLRKDILRLQNEKRGEMLKDEPDAGKVVELTAKIGAVRTEMQTNRVETRLAVRKLLTPEQRDKMLAGGGRGAGGACDGRGGHKRGDRAGCDGQGGGQGGGQRGGHGRGCDQGPGQQRGGRW